MAKDLAVFIVHGMGSPKKDFADAMINKLRGRIAGSERIAWRPIYWADALIPKQTELLDDAKRRYRLRNMFLRDFVVHYLGDPTAYRWVGKDPDSTYGWIHRIVRDTVRDTYENVMAREAKPVVIIAHSLGGHIMSNYIWDLQEGQPVVAPGADPFERLETLQGMITCGCNIPLFTFALSEVKPIRLPFGAAWFNYYDPDDVLAFPLKPLSASYAATVTADVPVNVGNLLTSWNPLSHTGYFTDDDFTVPVAKFLSQLLQ